MPGLSPFNDPMTGAQINARLAAVGLTLADDKFTVTGSADATKTFKFELDGMATGVYLVWTAGAQTADRSISLPVLTANDTLMTLGVAQTVTTLKTFSAGLTVSAGTTAVQALTATSGAFTAGLTLSGASPASFGPGLKITGSPSAFTGSGPEFIFASDRGQMTCFDRTGGVFKGFDFNALDINFQIGGTTKASVSSTAVTLAASVTSGLTIAATSGTNLTLASTGTALSCAGTGAFASLTTTAMSTFSRNTNAYGIGLVLQNTNTGSASASAIEVRNDTSGNAFISATSSTYTTTPAAAFIGASSGLTGGLYLTADNASGVIRLRTGGTDRVNVTNTAMTITATGLDRTVGGLAFTATATATVANTVVETSIIGTGTGTKTLPASFLTAGRTIRMRARGIISDTGTPTLNIKVKLGATLVIETGAFTLAGTITNNEFDVEFALVCRSAGVSGTVIASGLFHYDSSSGGSTKGMGSTSTVTIDTTASQVLDITATWGTASASNTISGQTATIEVLN